MLVIMLMMYFPILAQTNEMNLQNIEKTKEGWLLTDEQMVSLANHIKELKGYKEKSERQADLIDEYELQMANYKEQLKKEQEQNNFERFDDTLTGAGLASLIILIAGASN